MYGSTQCHNTYLDIGIKFTFIYFLFSGVKNGKHFD